jgi:glycosyltransferase involved in cell wall biosynthesis
MGYANQSVPAVTVIALCFNHARFLHECLNSIATQTMQDFQLIVADDCSKDNSAELIQTWLSAHRPDSIFIRHTQNAGLCKTLNEALSYSHGEFISMIATDDAWEPDKIERQLILMHRQSPNVAVVYADATRMDETSQRLAPDFIEAHTPECNRPSGRVFAELANRNFIPAMATLIRRQALIDVGGYDERLTYEDYDMWLRLAAKYEFVYCPLALARYRIVATSLVRTVFFKPTAQHHLTLCLICHKWLPSGLLSPKQKTVWADRLWGSAYGLYQLGDSCAKRWLWHAVRYTRKPRALLLALACSLGISRQFAKRLSGSTD